MEVTTTIPQTNAATDVYGIVTANIIQQLEKGTVPWQRPWSEAGLPKNMISGKYYRGINMMLLAMEGYEHNHFITFKQLQNIGGKVRKGEHGHMVVFWSKKDSQGTVDETAELNAAQNIKPILRYYYVFNISQCENLPEKYMPKERTVSSNATADQIVVTMPLCPKILHKEQKAYYSIREDIVNMPKKRSFKTDESYYSTLFHELVHSTGHTSRLNRDTITQMAEFGGEAYSIEELIAEMGTCYLQCFAGITSEFKQSAAYIQGWLEKLKNDKRFIFKAANAAQKAVDYILNIQQIAEEHPETP